MAQLLFNWLNEEVKLSQLVTSFEDDFKDGYLLGELLYKFNQQDNFSLFDRKFTPDSRIKNFCLLEPTVRRLGAPFNFALAFDIMKGKMGVTKGLLVELRTILERIKKNSQPPIAPIGQRGQIMRVMRPGSERFDKSMSAAFEKSVRALMDNPTEVILHNQVTAKFEAIGQANDELAESGDNRDQWETLNEKLRKREIFEHRKKHEGEFKKSWELMNVEQWKKNQLTGRTRKIKEEKEITDYQTRRQVHFQSLNDHARAETFSSINAFDKRLEREVFREDPNLAAGLGASLKKTVQGAEGSGLPTLEYTDQAFLDAGLVQAQKTMKEHQTVEQQRQQVHDRRRRKFLRQQERTHASNLHLRAQSEIVEQLLNESKAESLESATRHKIFAHKDIFLENRTLRKQRVQEVEDMTSQARERQSIEICDREKNWVVASHKQSQRQRAACLQEAKTSAATKRALEFSSETVDRVLDLVDWVVSVRHLGLFHLPVPPRVPKEGEDPEVTAAAAAKIAAEAKERAEHPLRMDLVPASLWTDAKEMFTSSLPMAEATMKPFETNVYTKDPYRLSQRPLCVDLNWLLSQTSQTHLQMAPKGTLQQEITALASAPSPAMPSPSVLTVVPAGEEAPQARQVSEHLATVDANAFVNAVATVEIGDYAAPAAGAALPAENKPQDMSNPTTSKLVVSPDWLYTTPPRNLLGEVLVAVSCAANPIKQDPEAPVDVPALPLRAALCGVSDVGRAAICTALKSKMPDLAIINSEMLLHRATQLATDTLLAESQDSVALATRTAEQILACRVLDHLQSGQPLTDELYVALVVQGIQASLPPKPPVLSERELRDKREADAQKTEKVLAEEKVAEARAAADLARRYPGFLLEDFPRTKEQSVLLFEALSGIKYDDDKPSVGDRVSPFATALPSTYARVSFDPRKCGLNKIIYLDQSDLISVADERACSRIELTTGEIVQLHDGTQSIDTLQEVYTPLRPFATSSVEHAQTASSREPLVEFLQSMNLVSCYSVGQWDGDFPTRERAIAAVVEDVAALTGLFRAVETPETTESDDVSSTVQANVISATSAASSTQPVSAHLEQRVAAFLVGMWRDAEKYSKQCTRSYFAAIRDVRHEMIQRKRAVHDVIQRVLIKRDSRQNQYEEFADRFNMIPDDLRFDFGVMAELFQRALELGRGFWALSDDKRKEAQDVLKGISRDGVTSVLVHRVQAEGAALIQSELKRFLVSTHVLFDFTKGTAAFDSSKTIRNTLEACLEPVIPSVETATEAPAASKDKGKAPEKGKKGEVATAIAWRNVVPNVLLPIAMMKAIPEPAPAQEEAAVDPKAKGKAPPAKGKAVVEEVPANPLDTMAAAAIAHLADWSKGTFVVQRAVYPGQEALCVALESAIWHEAERCKFSIDRIKHSVNMQTTWLAQMEAELLSVMDSIVRARHQKECQVTHRLVHMIGDVIHNADKLAQVWRIDSDAITVFANATTQPIVQAAAPVPVQSYYDNKLNDEQIGNFSVWIDSMKTGHVVLEQDVQAMLIRAQAALGPIGDLSQDSMVFKTGPLHLGPSAAVAVTVVQCQGLINSNSARANDCYATLRIKDTVYSTKKAENNLSPKFDEKFTLQYDGDGALEVHAFIFDPSNAHECVGSAIIDLQTYSSRLEAGEEVILDKFPLVGNGKDQGSVTLSIALAVPKNPVIVASATVSLTLPPHWRTPRVFKKLLDTVLPTARVTGVDESVGYVDAGQFLTSLRDFDSDLI